MLVMVTMWMTMIMRGRKMRQGERRRRRRKMRQGEKRNRRQKMRQGEKRNRRQKIMRQGKRRRKRKRRRGVPQRKMHQGQHQHHHLLKMMTMSLLARSMTCQSVTSLITATCLEATAGAIMGLLLVAPLAAAPCYKDRTNTRRPAKVQPAAKFCRILLLLG
jgi:hypothetical protein